MQISELVAKANGNAKVKGFWDSPTRTYETFATKLALIHSEVSEAVECLRTDYMAQKMLYFKDDGKPEGIASELADVVIRVADLAGELGIDLERAINVKMDYNASRPRMHGKVF